MKDLRFGKSAKDDRFTQRRTTVTREELPVVPMFPGVDPDLPSKNYSLASLGLDSLGCEGDAHIDAPGVFEAMGLDPLPAIPVFRAYATPAPSPTPAEPEKTPPALAHAPRFGIWSDGSLSMRIRSGFIELESDEFDALVNFLDRVRAGEVS